MRAAATICRTTRAQVQLYRIALEVLFNLPIRASCKKYSPRKSIMECDINSNGCNPGRAMMCENKSPLFVEIGTEMKTERIAAISQVMTGHSGWRRNPQHCMKKQERSRASFFNSQTFVVEEKWVTAAPNQASGSKSMQHRVWGGGKTKKKQFVP